MQELLELMKDGRAWSIEELALGLSTTSEDIKRQMEFLEHAGFLKRVISCGQSCKGCTAHCGSGAGLAGAPTFWELVPKGSGDKVY